jgi:amino acid permease
MNAIKIYNVLKRKDFTDEEAELIANALEQKDNVATKEDILRLELRTTVLWLVTIIVIIATNPRTLDFISKVWGIAK